MSITTGYVTQLKTDIQTETYHSMLPSINITNENNLNAYKRANLASFWDEVRHSSVPTYSCGADTHLEKYDL